MTTNKHKLLLEHAYNIKIRFLAMYKAANAGHIGCSLSCAEMMTYIFFEWMNEEDEFILSKGHAAAVLYSTLREKGYLSDEDISTFYKNNTYLAAHPPANKIKKIPFATGSLGHGLSLATGLALAARLKKSNKRTFCITSDGELNEGSTWEAAMFAAHNKLDNLIWLVDRNGLQGFGRTEEVIALEPLADKFKAFGFNVLTCDGHDFTSLEAMRAETDAAKGVTVIICNTVKGHDLTFFENTVDSHYLPLKDEQYTFAMNNLQEIYKQQIQHIEA